MPSNLAISLLLIVIFAAVTVSLSLQGLWTSLIAIPSVLAAAVFATAWHGEAARFLEASLGSCMNSLDMVAMWGIFAAVMFLLREVTDRVSRRKVAFPPHVERVGSYVAAFVAAWIVVAFAAATIQTAPFPAAVVQPTPGWKMLFGIAPDRKWLQFVRGSSANGPFAVSSGRFDAGADFIVRHARRRIPIGNASQPPGDR